MSTATEITPSKIRVVPEPPPVILEVQESARRKPKKKAVKKKLQPPPQEDYNIHEIIIDPDEEILLEGEMLKFKPGIEKNFISRWI